MGSPDASPSGSTPDELVIKTTSEKLEFHVRGSLSTVEDTFRAAGLGLIGHGLHVRSSPKITTRPGRTRTSHSNT